jgi:hypothetical protein
MSANPIPKPRAIVIGRISDEGDRAATGHLSSDEEQLERAVAKCERSGFEVIQKLYERNVSGHAPLHKRPFGAAIARVENGDAEAIFFAYRDRHDRSIEEGSKAIQRMDAVGALLMAGDEELSHRTHALWRQSTMGSFLAEDAWRGTRERTMNNVLRQIREDKVVPHALGPGFIRNDDGSVRIDEQLRPHIVEAFAMRARHATIREVHAYLLAKGVTVTHKRTTRPIPYNAVKRLLHSPLYIGELRFPDKPRSNAKNPELPRPWAGMTFRVCEPMIERDVWDAVQAMTVPAGRRAKSPLLLARIGNVHCATCGANMVVSGSWASYTTTKGQARHKRYDFYKCGRHNECPNPPSISAPRLHNLVLARTKLKLADGSGRASSDRTARELDAIIASLDTHIASAEARFVTLRPDAPHDEARAAIDDLYAQRDNAIAQRARLRDGDSVETTNAAVVLDDTDPAALPAQRRLILYAWADITVTPGRVAAANRVHFEPQR